MGKIEIIPDSIQLIKLTDQEYFSDKYKEYISNSRLGLLNPDEGGSIEKYNAGFQNKYSESFELGSAVHAMILQPDYYNVTNIYKPGGKLGQFADKVFQYENEGINRDEAIQKASIEADYYAGKLSEKRLATALSSCEPYWEERRVFESNLDTTVDQIYLSSSMSEKFKQCMFGIESNKEIMQTLHPEGLIQPIESYNEYAILTDIKVTLDNEEVIILKIKGKLDNFTINHDEQLITLNDVKTTGKPASFFMGNWVKLEDKEEKVWYDGSFQHYHYYRQMATYLWLLDCALKATRNLNYALKANMLVVETTPDFKSRLCHVTQKQIKEGLSEFKKLIMILANNG